MYAKIGNYVLELDEEDKHFLDEFPWTYEVQKHNCVYFLCRYEQASGIKITIKLHRLINGATIIKDGYVFNNALSVDHKNRNTLDNRRENLRFCTKSQNAMNSKKRVGNTSGHKGVSWEKNRQKWKAYLNLQGKQIHLGYFDSKQEAVIARLKGAQEIFGEFFAEEVERLKE